MPSTPPKKPKQPIQQASSYRVTIHEVLRDPIDAEALADALMAIVPTLDPKLRDELAIEGRKIREQLEKLSDSSK